MSDEIYQGSDTSEDQKFLAEGLDLFSVSNRYKKFWMLPEHTPHHQAISILVGRGISYDVKVGIMDHIKSSLGSKDITPQNFHITDKKLKSWGLSGEKISGIRNILALQEVSPKTLCKIKEGGIHLVKSFKILTQEDDDVFLPEEYNVMKNLGILFFRSKPMSRQEAMIISRNWLGYRSQISYFLTRLKPEGAMKILDEDDLEPWDFYGKDVPKTPALPVSQDVASGKDEVPELV